MNYEGRLKSSWTSGSAPLLCLHLHNIGALLPVHELFKPFPQNISMNFGEKLVLGVQFKVVGRLQFCYVSVQYDFTCSWRQTSYFYKQIMLRKGV